MTASADDIFRVPLLCEDILSYLSCRELVIATGVCKAWRSLVFTRDALRKRVFLEPTVAALQVSQQLSLGEEGDGNKQALTWRFIMDESNAGGPAPVILTPVTFIELHPLLQPYVAHQGPPRIMLENLDDAGNNFVANFLEGPWADAFISQPLVRNMRCDLSLSQNKTLDSTPRTSEDATQRSRTDPSVHDRFDYSSLVLEENGIRLRRLMAAMEQAMYCFAQYLATPDRHHDEDECTAMLGVVPEHVEQLDALSDASLQAVKSCG
jgi:hypothetical protein